MYDLNDTIVAVSSGSGPSGTRAIVRISGPDSFTFAGISPCKPKIAQAPIVIDDELTIESSVYIFRSPNSYTGDDLVEIHLFASEIIIERLVQRLIHVGCRSAGPGEFTARAYLNGKIDLVQAEAVAEIVSSSNRFQLAVAEDLLAGALVRTVSKISDEILDSLSLIEAGLDFSDEDIEFITTDEAVAAIEKAKDQLNQLLQGGINLEAMLELPSIGIAGAPNAGKSSLSNILLGQSRSIVSAAQATTRDVLTGLLKLDKCDCVLFDCAGLQAEPEEILEKLAQQAAIRALAGASLVIFCVDMTRENYDEDLSLLKLIEAERIIFTATKCDLLSAENLAEKSVKLEQVFDHKFEVISSETLIGLDKLRGLIEQNIIKHRDLDNQTTQRAAVTQRHKQAVTEAIENLTGASEQLCNGDDEIASMLLRKALVALAMLETEGIDEKILSQIFSRFCIGK